MAIVCTAEGYVLVTGKGARLVTAGSKLGAACIKLHTGLGQGNRSLSGAVALSRNEALAEFCCHCVPLVRVSRMFQQLVISAV